MDCNDATSRGKSEEERQDGAWVATHSATGAAAIPRNEGSSVVGAVSSEMAIL